MSTPLVTPAMLSAVRTIGAKGLQDDITILRRSIIDGGEEDDYEVWVDMGTALGWARLTNIPTMHDGGSGVVESIGRYRFHFSPDTEIYEGDMLAIGSEQFLVNDVNADNTYRVFTTVVARKRE